MQIFLSMQIGIMFFILLLHKVLAKHHLALLTISVLIFVHVTMLNTVFMPTFRQRLRVILEISLYVAKFMIPLLVIDLQAI